jgi:hypothetical protein
MIMNDISNGIEWSLYQILGLRFSNDQNHVCLMMKRTMINCDDIIKLHLYFCHINKIYFVGNCCLPKISEICIDKSKEKGYKYNISIMIEGGINVMEFFCVDFKIEKGKTGGSCSGEATSLSPDLG